MLLVVEVAYTVPKVGSGVLVVGEAEENKADAKEEGGEREE